MSASRTRIKICGITREEDARGAAELGADAIGLVFYARSPRAVDPARARLLLSGLSAFVTSVGLFVDAEPAEVRRVLAEVPLDLLQFHGQEDAAYCASFGRPWIKALRVRPGHDLGAELAAWPGAAGLLLDAWHPDLPGGTGASFDWNLVPRLSGGPALILAGGLRPDNVAEAVARVRPYAVDVSSGVESAPGLKALERMRAFIAAVSAGPDNPSAATPGSADPLRKDSHVVQAK